MMDPESESMKRSPVDGLPVQIVLSAGVVKLGELFCGCSDTDLTWKLIFEELLRLERKEFDRSAGLAAAICDHFGLSEHGTSIRGGWLTDEGKKVLAFLRSYGLDWKDSHECEFVDSEGCVWNIVG